MMDGKILWASQFMRRSLFFKIFGTYLAIIVVSFSVLSLFIRDEMKEVMTDQIKGQLLTYAELVNLGSTSTISRQIVQIARISGARVTLIDAAGEVLADSEKKIEDLENHLNRPEIRESRLKGRGYAIRYSTTAAVEMLYVAVPLKSGQDINGYVRLDRPLS